MSNMTERRGGWPFSLPDVVDWIESGVPGMRGRPVPHGIRVEEQIVQDSYVLRSELPGIDPGKDVEITVDDGVLTLRAERVEREEGAVRSEFRYGAFARSLRLPSGARPEDATAEYKDGILTVTVPLAAAKTAARTISVRRGSR